ncbi:MAG: HD domain-containing phosphohydrolase [Thermodesulfobacteriota bacterium]
MNIDGKRYVLVVDDEESIRKVLDTHLTREGFGVIQSCGGAGVFDELRGVDIDLIISDIRMPEVDGIRILEFVRENMETVPVVMLTGFTDINIAIEVMKKGAFDFLMKPVRKEDLMVVVRKAMSNRDLLVRNKELEQENKEYQVFLEQKVRERTTELNAKAMELQKAYGMLKSMNIQFVNVLAETIEAKDNYTRGHCNRMRYLCVEMGRLAGLTPNDLEVLEYASLLHDLGKIAVNETVLNKQGPLTEQECEHIKEHPEVGERILSGIALMEPVASIIASHHENFDGTGYPNGLKGAEIPFGSRIIAVADIYDAMTTDRPYRKGLPLDVVLREMHSVAGTQLDPEIVDLFIENKLYLFKTN